MGHFNKTLHLNDVTIILEHWQKNIESIRESIPSFDDYDVYFEPSIKVKKKGRCSMGLVMFAKKEIKSIGYYLNSRIGVLKYNNLAVIFLYMPYELKSGPNRIAKENEYISCLSIAAEHYNELKQDNYDVIIAGDLNCDPTKKTNRYSALIHSFMRKIQVELLDICSPLSYNYTYKTEKTFIDRVIGTKQAFPNLLVDIKPQPTSTSDHFALKISTEVKPRAEHQEKRFGREQRVPIDILQTSDFREKVVNHMLGEIKAISRRIDLIQLEFSQSEFDNIFIHLNFLINQSINEVYSSIKKQQHTNHKKNSGWWNEKAQKAHDAKQLLMLVPLNQRSSQMKSEIRILKGKITKIKKEFDRNKRNNIVKKIDLQRINDSKRFWKTMNRQIKNQATVTSSIVKLRENFDTLFNKKLFQNTSHEDACKIQLKNIMETNQKHPRNDVYIERHLIDTIISELPNGRAVGHSNISADMVKCCSSMDFNGVIHKLINTIVSKCAMPKNMNISIMIPLVKDSKKSSSDLNNIRPISISECLASILERVLLYWVDKKWPLNEKQFGFVKGASCSHPIFVLTELMKLTKKKRQKLYIASIDASKAFDKVSRPILFVKLMDMVGYTITSTIMEYYSNTQAIVFCNGMHTDPFATTIGVKQGGPLSPRLFSLYIEELIISIDSTNLGVKLKRMRISTMLYADDIILVSNTKYEINKMLDIVTRIGTKLQIKFNPDKTNYMSINEHLNIKNHRYSNDDKLEVKMDNEPIKKVQNVKYLGNLICESLKNVKHVSARIAKAVSVSLKLKKQGLLKGATAKTMVQLHKTYIRPVLYYGLDSIVMTKDNMASIRKFESKSIKWALNLPPRLKNSLLFNSLGMDTFEHRLRLMKLNFFARMIKNPFTLIFIKSILCEYNKHPKI